MYLAYPIRFSPIYRDYVWGGARIAEKYKRQTPLTSIAESWEISDRLDGMSIVANGPFQGLSLRELTFSMGERLLGENRNFSSFPLLIKILDAKEPLSVQVHPNDMKASLLGAEPKTEMWYVLEAFANSVVYAGFKHGVTKETFLQALQEEKLLELLEVENVATSDAVYIPGGCVHAIGAGCLMLEVQQNSDSTYRIYDWQRQSPPRQLHIQEALQTIDWSFRGLKRNLSQKALFTECPYFTVQRLEIFEKWSVPSRTDTFQIFFCLSGEGSIAVDGLTEPIQAGMTYLVPACFISGEILGTLQLIHIALKK